MNTLKNITISINNITQPWLGKIYNNMFYTFISQHDLGELALKHKSQSCASKSKTGTLEIWLHLVGQKQARPSSMKMDWWIYPSFGLCHAEWNQALGKDVFTINMKSRDSNCMAWSSVQLHSKVFCSKKLQFPYILVCSILLYYQVVLLQTYKHGLHLNSWIEYNSVKLIRQLQVRLLLQIKLRSDN